MAEHALWAHVGGKSGARSEYEQQSTVEVDDWVATYHSHWRCVSTDWTTTPWPAGKANLRRRRAEVLLRQRTPSQR